MTAAAMTAMSCGDGRTARDREDDDLDNTELAEPDSTMTESDTTSTGDMDQRQDDNDMDRGESRDLNDDNTRTQRDSIQ